MAEIFIPKIVDQLTDIALKKVQERVSLVVGAEEEVKKLSKTLNTLKRMLYDAESRRLEDDDVLAWLEMLDGVAYEMEDVLEEWNIKIVKTKEMEPRPTQKPTLFEKVCMFIQSCSSCLKQVPLRSEFGLKIKEINDKLDSILTEAQKFRFVTRFPHKNPFYEFKRPITMSNVDESKVYGRENDKDTLIEHLLYESHTSINQEVVIDDRFKVISIVGLGGSGKTTLAQLLYNDERVRKHFSLKKWICVSDPFDELRIAKSLIESSGSSEIEPLLQHVKDFYSKNRFLLVLDDVWTEKSEWEQIMLSFKECVPGSVILVTTRSEWVARALGSHHLHKLSFLKDSDCWLIIKQKALSGTRSIMCKSVEEIGLRIAYKCKGLPLAAKTLGGVLLFRDTTHEWQAILDSKVWQMKKPAMELFPHFYLSYKELSPEMKMCFSFCAIYPKDHEIYIDNLIKMWMAQGYLGNSERMEMEGGEVVKNLAVRSLFQELEKSDYGLISCVKMHDLVHDFAQFLKKGECQAFVEGEANGEVVESEGFIERRPIRHVMVHGKARSILDFLGFDIGNLRTLSLKYVNIRYDETSDASELALSLCSRLKSVRALILGYYWLNELPREIGTLIHLRYLDVSDSSFGELPETICDLHYLEILDITRCFSLKNLPERFGDLRHLRQILNGGTRALKQTQRGIENLTSLRVVKVLVLRADGAPFSVLAKLKHFEELGVDFKDWNDRDSMDVALLEIVQLMSYLRKLTIWCYAKPQLPKEMVSKLANSSITHLHLEDCLEISSLPALGKLPFLQHLTLTFLPKIKHIGGEFYGLLSKEDVPQIVRFPVLKTLRIEHLWNWKTWEDICENDDKISVMPLLEKLVIEKCRMLEALPHQMLENASCLKELYLSFCGNLRIEKSWMRAIRTGDDRETSGTTR